MSHCSALRAFGDGSRNFEPWSSDEDDTRAGTPTTPTGGPTRGLLATDHVILNHGQVTWTTPELAPPLLTTTPHQREDVSALDRFSVHRCPTRRVFSGTGLELVTKPATIRCLYHSATAASHQHGEWFNQDIPQFERFSGKWNASMLAKY
ncbi:uncharacterized protein TNCV_1824301 [Trichonephila clavipes]|nr:uncharacterized protein TNCV_1824301 [Trichonephila clavipes]